MKSHAKKMIAPIVVATVMLLYYGLYFGVLLAAVDGLWRYLLGILPLAMAGVTIYVCVQRIREIKEGEEDDISQY